MMDIKMTLEERNRNLSMIDDKINSKIDNLYKNRKESLNESLNKNEEKKILEPSNSTLLDVNEKSRKEFVKPKMIDFSRIEQEIKLKNELLLEKKKYLKKISQDNRFLKNVNNDYEQYYDFIIKQKEYQIKTLNFLDNYIKDITKNTNLTDQDIIETNEEQKRILEEIKNIKKSLKEIIQS